MKLVTYRTLRIRGAGDRADKTLLERLRPEYPGITRAKLRHLFETDSILFRGRPLDASRALPPGEHEIELSEEELLALAEKPEAKPSPRGSFLGILFESDSLLVVNKASGIPSAPQSTAETETAVGAALAHFPALSGVGYGGLEPGLLHRLDTGTSGALAFAKSQSAFDRLKPLWSSGEVRKVYRAICAPKVPGRQALATPSEHHLWLAHDARSTKRMIALKGAPSEPTRTERNRIRGKPLETFTKLVKASPVPEGLFDVEIEIRTGVMHQIRCTLEHLGWPVVGDPLYRGRPAERLWLHAWKLELPDENGSRIRIEAPLPTDWPRVTSTSK